MTTAAHRRAKIVYTLGPATETRLADLIVTGMDVARLNVSHGDQADHQRVYGAVRDAADAVGITVDDVPGTLIVSRRRTPRCRPTRSRATACSSTTAASGWRSSTSRARTSSAR